MRLPATKLCRAAQANYSTATRSSRIPLQAPCIRRNHSIGTFISPESLPSRIHRPAIPFASPSPISFAHYATIARRNPRKDDDGNEMIVDITPSAAKRLKEIMTQDANPALALRVTVQSGGCHGFQYLMSLASADDASPEDDTVFEADDGSGAKVVMDEPSLELLKGSKVDYETALIGSQFKIIDNPAASSACGCGTSFDIKP